MTKVQIKATFSNDIEDIWQLVTDLNKQQWRKEIANIEIIDDKTFIEHTKDGFSTTFTITKKIPYQLYEFDMENENMSGHWTGHFSSQDNQTFIEFIEDVTAKKLYMKPFVKSYLTKQQKTFIHDLKETLNAR